MNQERKEWWYTMEERTGTVLLQSQKEGLEEALVRLGYGHMNVVENIEPTALSEVSVEVYLHDPNDEDTYATSIPDLLASATTRDDEVCKLASLHLGIAVLDDPSLSPEEWRGDFDRIFFLGTKLADADGKEFYAYLDVYFAKFELELAEADELLSDDCGCAWAKAVTEGVSANAEEIEVEEVEVEEEEDPDEAEAAGEPLNVDGRRLFHPIN